MVKGVLKITDFGLSAVTEIANQSSTAGALGTVRWLAPECLGGKVTEKSDVYALGIFIWELLSREVPFGDVSNDLDVIKLVKEEKRPGIEGWPELIADIITMCWEQHPAARPTAAKVFDYFKRHAADWSKLELWDNKYVEPEPEICNGYLYQNMGIHLVSP